MPASRSSIRRLLLIVAILLSMAVLAAGGFLLNTSRAKNAELRRETEALQARVAKIDWTDRTQLSDALDSLDLLRIQVEKLQDWEREGPPEAMQWGMYAGDELLVTARERYIEAVGNGLIAPARQQLETKLRNPRNLPFYERYDTFKSYLLLGHTDRVVHHRDFLTLHLTDAALAATGDAQSAKALRALRHKVASHTGAYVDMMIAASVPAEKLDDKLVGTTREALGRPSAGMRLYETCVSVLETAKADPTRPAGEDNRRYPDVTLATILADRPQAMKWLVSKAEAKEGKGKRVRGPYTAVARRHVMKNLSLAVERAEQEAWIVPFSHSDVNVADVAATVASDYHAQYLREWVLLFLDIQVIAPQTKEERVALYKTQLTPPHPYKLLLKAVDDNVKPLAPEKSADAEKLEAALLPVAKFGRGELGTDSPLNRYLAALDAELEKLKISDGSDRKSMREVADTELAALNDTGRQMLTHLLIAPTE